MVSQPKIATQHEIIYPDSDGKPMAENTIQFRWIMTIYHNLAWLFALQADVFVAGDLLWYPVEGNNKIRQAPDVMVVFGVEKGDRGSYQQWKEKAIAPQVVLEILSPGNRPGELTRKLLFYEHYGVEEYYIYDPENNDLSGCIRSGDHLAMIEEMQNWVSPRLQVRFELSEETLTLYNPQGQPFSSPLEIEQQLQQERSRAEQERSRAEQVTAELEEERSRAEQVTAELEEERSRAEQVTAELEEERRKAKRLEMLLREAGIDGDRL
ncbi:Uma2 family endonuclease [Limnospira fusiformis PMC 851.14]|uniref:Uma2 family endonuclease n=1 Tax=Limnospira fusiformis PMC 851.14 TaxID=2219512 RepID=A0ABU9EH74_LIMFS